MCEKEKTDKIIDPDYQMFEDEEEWLESLDEHLKTDYEKDMSKKK